MRIPSGLSTTDSSASPYARTTPRAVYAAKPSRYARVYASTSPKPVIATPLYQSRTLSRFTYTLQQLADQRLLFFQFRD